MDDCGILLRYRSLHFIMSRGAVALRAGMALSRGSTGAKPSVALRLVIREGVASALLWNVGCTTLQC